MNESIKQLKKFWKWLWHSDSLLSWIIALIFAFIIVKFIFFPLLSLIFHTSLPLVVIESGSMSHPQSNFFGNTLSLASSFEKFWSSQGSWYPQVNITESQFSDFPFKTGMEKGDIIVVSNWKKPKVGDVIIFNANQQYPIIHRVMKINQQDNSIVYSTKGDNNPAQLEIEKGISESAVIGKSILKIPKLGWLKLMFVEIFRMFR